MYLYIQIYQIVFEIFQKLAHDFGQILGCGGFLSSLRRTRIGEFPVDDAMGIDAFVSLVEQMKSNP